MKSRQTTPVVITCRDASPFARYIPFCEVVQALAGPSVPSVQRKSCRNYRRPAAARPSVSRRALPMIGAIVSAALPLDVAAARILLFNVLLARQPTTSGG